MSINCLLAVFSIKKPYKCLIYHKNLSIRGIKIMIIMPAITIQTPAMAPARPDIFMASDVPMAWAPVPRAVPFSITLLILKILKSFGETRLPKIPTRAIVTAARE